MFLVEKHVDMSQSTRPSGADGYYAEDDYYGSENPPQHVEAHNCSESGELVEDDSTGDTWWVCDVCGLQYGSRSIAAYIDFDRD